MLPKNNGGRVLVHRNFTLAFLSLCFAIGAMGGEALPMASYTTTSVSNELLFAGPQTVVTAARTEQPINQSPAAVTVITADELRRHGVVTLLDALRYAVGVNVAEFNGDVANISIRGLTSQVASTVLVLLDNRPLNDQLTGSLFWNIAPLLISQIKRIEVVSGPGSSLYGANAFNGVINIITKTPAELADGKSNLHVRTVLGGYKSDYDELIASAADRHDNSVALTFAYNHTGGFGSGGATGARDNYATPFIGIDAEHKLGKSDLRLQAGDVESSGNIYPSAAYFPAITSHNPYIVLRYEEPTGSNPFDARISYSDFKSTSENTNINQSHLFEGEVQKQNTLSHKNTMVYGLAWSHTVFHSDLVLPGEHYQDLFGLYAQDEQLFAKTWRVYLGLRFDDATAYGATFSPRITLLKQLGARQILRFAFGRAFQAPTLLGLYTHSSMSLGPGLTALSLGNPHLKPVTLSGFELDWRKEFGDSFVEINSYYNRVQNLIGVAPIAFQPSPPYPPGIPSTFQFMNMGNTNIYGLEFDSGFQITKNIRMQFNYAYNEEHPMNNAPNHQANLALDGILGDRWDGFVGIRFVGTSTIVGMGAPPAVAPAYVAMDLRLGYKLKRGKDPWRLDFIVHNLFADHHIEEPTSSPPPGMPAIITPIRTVAYLALSGRF